MLASHSRRDRDLLVGEVDGELLSAHAHDGHPDASEHVAEEQVLTRTLQNCGLAGWKRVILLLQGVWGSIFFPSSLATIQ